MCSSYRSYILSLSNVSKNRGIALISTRKRSPSPLRLQYIITCSTSSWSNTRHISVISSINSLLALVGGIVADNDWFPFVSLSFVVVDFSGYSLPFNSITCIYLPLFYKDIHFYLFFFFLYCFLLFFLLF